MVVHAIDTRHGAADGLHEIIQLAYDPELREPAAVSTALAALADRMPRPAHARRDLAEVRRVTALLDIINALNAGLAEDMGIHSQLTHLPGSRARLAQLATLTNESAEAATALTRAAHLAVQSALGCDQPGAARAYTRTYDKYLATAHNHLRHAALFSSPRPANTPATAAARRLPDPQALTRHTAPRR